MQNSYLHFSDFWSIIGDRMANLGLIDFKIGLYIKVDVTGGKNKFEVHIYGNTTPVRQRHLSESDICPNQGTRKKRHLSEIVT